MGERPSGREETEANASTATSASCCRSCGWRCPASRSSSPSCWRSRSSRTSPKITEFQKDVYFATLLLTALSAALLISPSAYHRLTFRMQQKDHLIFLANRFAIAGLGGLALAMTGAIVLITDVLFGTTATIVTGVAALSVFVLFWYALPLKRRLSSEEEPDPPRFVVARAWRSFSSSLAELVDEGQRRRLAAQHLQVVCPDRFLDVQRRLELFAGGSPSFARRARRTRMLESLSAA